MNKDAAQPTILAKLDGLGFYRATIDYGNHRETLRYSHADRAAVILNAQLHLDNRAERDSWRQDTNAHAWPYSGGIA